MTESTMLAITSTVVSGIICSVFSMQMSRAEKREEKREEYLKQLDEAIKRLEISDRECAHKIDRINDLLLRRSETAHLKFSQLVESIERMEDQLTRISDYSRTRKMPIKSIATLTESEDSAFL